MLNQQGWDTGCIAEAVHSSKWEVMDVSVALLTGDPWPDPHLLMIVQNRGAYGWPYL